MRVDAELYPSLHLEIHGAWWMMPHPATLAPVWINNPMYRKLDGFRKQSGRMQKSDRHQSSNFILFSLQRIITPITLSSCSYIVFSELNI